MEHQKTRRRLHDSVVTSVIHEIIERLAGVKGPEQSLVGESRSDEQPDGAEERRERSERSEERSGVGKIVERTELMRQIDRMIDEAQRQMADTYTKDANQPYYTAMGRSAALIDLKIWLCDIAEKRSDLPNDSTQATAVSDSAQT